MAASLLVLLDDIATILDDVALLSKVAAKKTAGVLGDDLALNAQQLSGIRAERELPVVWAVGKGSLWNKAMLVPLALLLSALLPQAIVPLLMLGGAFLCFEGFEKVAHRWLHTAQEDDEHASTLMAALTDPAADLRALEKEQVKGAIRTDFILSAEIIAITLGTVQDSNWLTQLAVLSGVAMLMTVGVYGLVAAIVKLDDMGLLLMRRESAPAWVRSFGAGLVNAAPVLMKGLTVVGTAAMFLVGGGILAHGLPGLPHAMLEGSWSWLIQGGLGVVCGAVLVLVWTVVQRFMSKNKR
ncbi:DUF808 domain-containing protein [Curvibacter sp. CHRR-16]|uniref:DUF808 domain-containing protein n=1 Tax=Curvibacter sp. CHRR-16 TaxID=2835872 RepID=UPI001BD9CB6E|nr:DUF808 domain-containing protein [Curvibacter sp. CHRR-16]MBT0571598.1 DUF808 domain-containing protein [Curvibacter sp. CHRR-16]